jgi:uncharacterized protein YukE
LRKVVVMTGGGKLRVDLEALALSAAHVSGQGEDLASAHLLSDNQIVTAQSGWVGSSALAMGAKSAKWLEDSRRLVTSVGDHALDLNNDGLKFSGMERDAAQKLQALRPTSGPAGSA